MGCVLLLCKYGAQLLLTQKIGCGSGFTVAVFLFSGCRIGGSLLPRAGLPSREAGLRVISSGGSLPTPPDFYCLMAVKSEEVRSGSRKRSLFTIHAYRLSLI